MLGVGVGTAVGVEVFVGKGVFVGTIPDSLVVGEICAIWVSSEAPLQELIIRIKTASSKAFE
jgi:hypothetical protein